MVVYQYDYAEQPISITADVKDVLQHALMQGYLKMADGLKLAEAYDGEQLLVLVGWIGFMKMSVHRSQEKMNCVMLLVLLRIKTTGNVPKCACPVAFVASVRN